MTKRQQQLFNAAYAAAHMGADDLATLYSSDAVDWEKRNGVRQALVNLRQAVAALTSLESLLAGNPEPKRGE